MVDLKLNLISYPKYTSNWFGLDTGSTDTKFNKFNYLYLLRNYYMYSSPISPLNSFSYSLWTKYLPPKI